MMSLYDLKKYAETGIAAPGMTAFDKMRALSAFGGFPVKTITGVPPLTFQSDGTALTAWSISGNMVQDGTPTPAVPITPSECGEISENLYDQKCECGVTDGYYINKNTNQEQALSTYEISYPIQVTAGETYRWTFNDSNGQTHSAPTVGFYDDTDTMIGVASHANQITTFTFTVPTGCTYIRASVYKSAKGQAMLTAGTDIIDYVPHWKIPISCGGTTQTVYLSEPLRKIGDYSDTVSSDGTVTKNIYKYAITGTETITKYTSYDAQNCFFVSMNKSQMPDAGSPPKPIADRYAPVQALRQFIDTDNCVQIVGYVCRIHDSRFDEIENAGGIREYLSQQYANGTPVTVWYVLENPVTEQITVPTLTPTKGSNTLSVGTTLQPSDVSITGGIK